jgi:hypothetical protein
LCVRKGKEENGGKSFGIEKKKVFRVGREKKG